MKAPKSVNTVLTTAEKGYDMHVDTTKASKLIMLLTSGLYSNPMGSFTREITSNSSDAHKEIGSTEPVIVKADQKNARFIDFGPGLTPERVENVFSNYLSSTKESDNDQIGFWGLGSKSPLAYTDQFHIITRVDGTEWMYIMHKGELTTRLDCIYEKPTSERNGTEVIVPLKSSDVYTFQREVRKQLRYFTNIHFEIPGFEKNYQVYDGQYFRYSNMVNGYNLMHVVLGEVSYPVDFATLEIQQIKTPIAIKFEIGELMVTPNREAIIWTKEAKKLFLERLEKTAKELSGKFKAKTVPTYIDFLIQKQKDTYVELLGDSVFIDTPLKKHASFDVVYKGKLKNRKHLEWVSLAQIKRELFETSSSQRHKKDYFNISSLNKTKTYFSKQNRFYGKKSWYITQQEDAWYTRFLRMVPKKNATDPILVQAVIDEYGATLLDYDAYKVPAEYRGSKEWDRSKIIIHTPSQPYSNDRISFTERYLTDTDFDKTEKLVVYGMVSQKKQLGIVWKLGELLGIAAIATPRRNFPFFEDLDNCIKFETFMEGKTKEFQKIATGIFLLEELKPYSNACENGDELEFVIPKEGKELRELLVPLLSVGDAFEMCSAHAQSVLEVFQKVPKTLLDQDVLKTIDGYKPLLEACNNYQYIDYGHKAYGNLPQWKHTPNRYKGSPSGRHEFFKEYLKLKQVI